jgi:class 3 adenylate cyclase/tetratricopeptide (TPR) repeat protein
MLSAVGEPAYLSSLHEQWLAHEPAGASWRDVDGSLVFADVSGFTQLSERLARRGKAGAEELTDIVNEVVGGLLEAAVPLGGDLLKYGGDALLLLFTGDGHERRAASACMGMQQSLRRFRGRPTSAGKITLRMSVGADAGRFFFCLAGGSHRELLVAGPDVTRVASLEAAAEAGQVLLGSALAAALPAECVRPGSAGPLLRRAPASEAPPVRLDNGAADELVGLPVALRPHLGTAVDGEHRQAVVAFVQFRGSDDLLAEAGPGGLADAVDQLVRDTQEVCERHGVTFLTTDLDKNGGKLILVAGAPTTTGDDADRMVSAVTVLLARPHRLRVRIGVNRGRVFAVEVGTEQRRVYTVMGDAVNLAARVMGAAIDGSCLATTAVLDRLGTEYVLEPVEPFMVKGKSEPVTAARLGEALRAVTAAGAGPGGEDTPLVGREEELAVLVGAVGAARAGHTRVVELVGEAGIGKSRLVAEMCRAAPDLQVVAVEGSQYASNTPYRAVRDAARGLLGLAVYAPEHEVVDRLVDTVRSQVPELEPWLPLLATPFGVELPDTPETAALAPAFRRRRLQEVTTALCAAVLPPAGVFVVEDAYWLDEGSADLVQHLIERLQEGFHWATCVARRGVPTALDLSKIPDVVRLELGPLPEAAAAGLVGELGGVRLTAAERQQLVERSGGNPLFLQELATAAARGTAIDELPDTVEGLIAAHIDTLAPPDRGLLRVASVLGVRFPADLLAKMVDDAAATSATVRRRLGEFLLADGEERLRFRHSLIREVAYEGLSFKRRRALHAEAAELVEEFAGDDREGASEALSLHYFAAGRYLPAWHWSRVAGERARRQAAPVEAAAFFQRALEAARHAGVARSAVAATHEVLGDVCELGGRYEQAAEAYRRARRLRGGDDVSVGNLLRKEGWVKERAGRYREALRWYARGFRAVEAAPPSAAADRLKAELYLAYGAVRIRQGRHRDSVPLLEEAVRLAEPLGALPTLAHAYYDLDWAWTELGRPDPRYRELALPIYRELGDWGGQGNTLNNLGLGAYYEGRWDEAADFWRRSHDAFQRVGDIVQQATIANNLGEILSDQGLLTEAADRFREALTTWSDAEFLVGIGLATSNLGRVAARSGRFAEAAELLHSAVEQLRSIGAGELASEAEAREAERRLLEGDHAGALEHAESVRTRANRPTLVAQVERTIGYAHAQQGDVDAALEWLHRSVETAAEVDAAYEEAVSREALVRVRRLAGEMVTPDAAAGAIFDRLGVVWTPQPPLPGLPAVVGRV